MAVVKITLFFLILTFLAFPIGQYLAKVYDGKKTLVDPILKPIEKFFYKLCGIKEEQHMNWKEYSIAFLIFNGIGLLVLFLILLFQKMLPLNPQDMPNLSWHLALNTAISFVTNTNWQSYNGEQTMSYFSQMLGLGVQNFLSAAVGMAAGVVLIRGFRNRTSEDLGNFWVDTTRSLLYVLIPLSIIWSVVLVSQGVVQTFDQTRVIQTIEGTEQKIAVGPAASQVAIKQLGSNGGGFYNANSAHPLENPTPFSNFLEILAILLLPSAFPFMLGAMMKKQKQGAAIYIVMTILFFIGLRVSYYAESKGNPALSKEGIQQGQNLEGKETRIGIDESILWGNATTVTSNGSVNSMHDSTLPLTGMVYMFNMAIGEPIFGGVGVGLISMIFYIMFTMFLAGLMIGRTPEFLQKKLEPFEMTMAVIALILPTTLPLLFTAVAVSTEVGLASLNNAGSHGFSEIFYAFASGIGNNGSAFAGLNANVPFYNVLLSVIILAGRLLTILPAIAVAGSLAKKKLVPETAATFPTTSPLFVGMVVAVIFIVGALTFFPVFSLGPILEHLQLYKI
ncbi:MAG: potassium-transporting ATPase subunit KdpA [bacterium]